MKDEIFYWCALVSAFMVLCFFPISLIFLPPFWYIFVLIYNPNWWIPISNGLIVFWIFLLLWPKKQICRDKRREEGLHFWLLVLLVKKKWSLFLVKSWKSKKHKNREKTRCCCSAFFSYFFCYITSVHARELHGAFNISSGQRKSNAFQHYS
jgi:hypothetical protein